MGDFCAKETIDALIQTLMALFVDLGFNEKQNS